MIFYDGNQKDAEDIMTCCNSVLSTVMGSVPYMRDMGVPADIIGQGVVPAEGAYMDAAIEQLELWEPRIVVSGISCNVQDGAIRAKVVVSDADK